MLWEAADTGFTMLSCLRVRNFAIIDELEVELGPGLNVVTGETGAGKSILVSALGLILGGKGRPEMVRTGETSAEVEALFELPPTADIENSDGEAAADGAGGALATAAGTAAPLGEDGQLVIRRVVGEGGRTRCYVNGRLATTAELSTLAEGLADISSQHEHHSLVDPKNHLDYLDAFGEHMALRREVGRAHRALGAAVGELNSLRQLAEDQGERQDLLRFKIREIDELDPHFEEEATLIHERERLRHAERLATTAASAEDVLYARDNAICASLDQLVQDLDQAAEIDPALRPVAQQLEAARLQLEESSRELGSYARRVTTDPDRLSEVEERLDRIGRLKRKYGGTIAGILEERERAGRELSDWEHYEERLAELESTRERALAEADRLALDLRHRRIAAAERLGTAISKELGSLGMGDAKVEVAVQPLEGRGEELEVAGARFTSHGIDRAEFLIAANRGEQARPLRKIASGGELSRAMLAIKCVLADLGPGGLYVFDEVDAGVGGAVAEVIGRKLAEVARHHQVLCITHLPQIAVYGDGHYHVHKGIVEDRTKSAIEKLNEDRRLEELARMLGGLSVTETTRAAASELLAQARDAQRTLGGRNPTVASPANRGRSMPDAEGSSRRTAAAEPGSGEAGSRGSGKTRAAAASPARRQRSPRKPAIDP